METLLSKATEKTQRIDVKSMPTDKIAALQNSTLKKIASSVGDSSAYGTSHQNHNSGGGHTRS